MNRRMPVVNGNKVYWLDISAHNDAWLAECKELDISVVSKQEGLAIARVRQMISNGNGYAPTDEGEY